MDTTQDIITAFELYTGGSLSLSSTEELELCQKIYDQMLDSHDFSFLKKTASGVLSTTTPNISQPADFNRMLTNKKIIYTGTNYSETYVVPFEDKRQYANQRSYGYDDVANSRFVLTKQPTSTDPYEFDYLFDPPALDLATSNPVFPKKFYRGIYHGMLLDNDIIELSDKSRTYEQENQVKYNYWLERLTTWDSKRSGYDTYGI